MKKILILLLGTTIFASCSNIQGDEKIETAEFDETAYLQEGESITTLAQGVLMKNVANAIQERGVPGAVDFCNFQAMPLTDSISQLTFSYIQRLSDKNRNPDNAIKDPLDKKAWEEIIRLDKDSTNPQKHFVLQENNQAYYYKPIKLGMPTCIKCHGVKEKDISLETLAVINKKYPNDKATGYQLGELRGMWKVKIKEI